MSTPPFLTLPHGAVVETWDIPRGPRQVLHIGLDTASSWAVLVPGFTGSKEDFVALLEPLLALDYAVLTFDQLGQYQSPGSDDPADYTLLALAEDLRAVIDLGLQRRTPVDPPHLLGHSFGGLVTQVALGSPQVAAASWVGLCTGPGALPEHRRGPLPALSTALPHTPLEELWEAKRAMERAAQEPDPAPDVEAFCRERWLSNHPVGLRAKAEILCSTPSVLADLASRPHLPKAVVYGEHDDAWPLSSQCRMAAEVGAEIVVVPHAGHSPNAESPATTAALLAQWWRQSGHPLGAPSQTSRASATLAG